MIKSYPEKDESGHIINHWGIDMVTGIRENIGYWNFYMWISDLGFYEHYWGVEVYIPKHEFKITI